MRLLGKRWNRESLSQWLEQIIPWSASKISLNLMVYSINTRLEMDSLMFSFLNTFFSSWKGRRYWLGSCSLLFPSTQTELSEQRLCGVLPLSKQRAPNIVWYIKDWLNLYTEVLVRGVLNCVLILLGSSLPWKSLAKFWSHGIKRELKFETFFFWLS